MSPSTQYGATAQYRVSVCDIINYEVKKEGADRKVLVQTLPLGRSDVSQSGNWPSQWCHVVRRQK